MSDKLKAKASDIKQKWLALDANKRRIIIGVGVVCFMILFAKYLGDKKNAEIQAQSSIPKSSDVQKTSVVAPKVGEASLDDLKGLTQSEIERQRQQQEALIQNQQQIATDYKTGNEQVGQQITDLARQLASVTDEVKSMRLGQNDSSSGVTLPPLQGIDDLSTTDSPKTPTQTNQDAPQPIQPSDSVTPDQAISARNVEPQVDQFQVIRSNKKSSDFQGGGFISSSATGDSSKNQTMDVQAKLFLQKSLPTGSILEGVLLNGMDAPTGGKGNANAVPALIRIKANAILPNRYSQQVRECFVLVSGIGNLATERADMRGEKISCIFKDGTSVDTSISAYIVGEDGKGGMRGRVVTKQGAVIARSIFAGTLSGLGKQLAPQSVPSLNISGGSQTEYQTPNIGNASKVAVASGVGSALDRVANFYMDIAEQMVSVIEIDAGRNVTVILTNHLKEQKQ